jgi:hypothetical protein
MGLWNLQYFDECRMLKLSASNNHVRPANTPTVTDTNAVAIRSTVVTNHDGPCDIVDSSCDSKDNLTETLGGSSQSSEGTRVNCTFFSDNQPNIVV